MGCCAGRSSRLSRLRRLRRRKARITAMSRRMTAMEPITIPAIAPPVIVECDAGVLARVLVLVESAAAAALFMAGEGLPDAGVLLARLFVGDCSIVCMTCTAEQK